MTITYPLPTKTVLKIVKHLLEGCGCVFVFWGGLLVNVLSSCQTIKMQGTQEEERVVSSLSVYACRMH